MASPFSATGGTGLRRTARSSWIGFCSLYWRFHTERTYRGEMDELPFGPAFGSDWADCFVDWI
jgi:hypothetical protein